MSLDASNLPSGGAIASSLGWRFKAAGKALDAVTFNTWKSVQESRMLWGMYICGIAMTEQRTGNRKNTLASTPTVQARLQKPCFPCPTDSAKPSLPQLKRRCGSNLCCGGRTIAAHTSELAAGYRQTVRSFLFANRGRMLMSLSCISHCCCHLVLSARLRVPLSRRGSKACPYSDDFHRCSSALRVASICRVGPCHHSATQRMSAGL